MKRVLGACAVLLAVTVAGCGEAKPATVKSSDSSATVVDPESASPSPSPTPSPAPSPTPSPDSSKTAPLGSTVGVGTWDVKVTKVVLDASDAIRRANEINDRPKGQYVLVSFEATYSGSERKADWQSDLTWSFTTTDAQVHDAALVLTPLDAAFAPTEARKGGTVKGQVAFDLKPALIKGGTLSVEGYDDRSDEVYADFVVN